MQFFLGANKLGGAGVNTTGPAVVLLCFSIPAGNYFDKFNLNALTGQTIWAAPVFGAKSKFFPIVHR